MDADDLIQAFLDLLEAIIDAITPEPSSNWSWPSLPWRNNGKRQRKAQARRQEGAQPQPSQRQGLEAPSLRKPPRP